MGWTVRRQHSGVALGLSFLLVFTAVSASAEPLTLMWDPSPDVSVKGYVVYIGSASRRYATGIDVGSSTSFELPTLDPAMRYYMAVASYDHNRITGAPSVELVWGQGAPPVTAEPGAPPIPGNTSPISGNTADTKAPLIAITTPSLSERSQMFGSTVVVGGVAKDDDMVTSVDWRTNRGESGQATGTDAWIAAIPLYKGLNEVRITARDASGNVATTVLMIFRHPLGIRRAK